MNKSECVIDPANIDGELYVALTRISSSWIKVSCLPSELSEMMLNNFDAISSLKPSSPCFIKGPDEFGNPQSRDMPAHRFYQSFLNTPLPTSKTRRHYMFGESIPTCITPLHDYMNTISQYNQVVVNWYPSGKERLEFHGDWICGITPDSDIASVSLTRATEAEKCREFVIKAKKTTPDCTYQKLTIVARHGTIIRMGGNSQTEFDHGIPSSSQDVSPRIGITFRHYND